MLKGWKHSSVGTYIETKKHLFPQLNKAEFEDVDDEIRVQYEGFRPGMYIRLEISSIPCEFVTNFDPHYPIILGGLTSSEGNVGYLQVRHLLPGLKSMTVGVFFHNSSCISMTIPFKIKATFRNILTVQLQSQAT